MLCRRLQLWPRLWRPWVRHADIPGGRRGSVRCALWSVMVHIYPATVMMVPWHYHTTGLLTVGVRGCLGVCWGWYSDWAGDLRSTANECPDH